MLQSCASSIRVWTGNICHLLDQCSKHDAQASVTEDAAWGYLMQLAAALRAVHSMGLACRIALASSKILLLPGSRLRLGEADTAIGHL